MNSKNSVFNSILLGALICGLTQGPARAGSSSLYETFAKSARAATAAKKFGDAAQLWRSAVQQVENGGDSVQLVDALFQLGFALSREGKNEEAEGFLRRAAAIADKVNVPTNNKIDLISTLGFVLQAQGKLAEAQPLEQRAVEMAQASNNKFLVAAALANLASLYQRQGKLREANALYPQILPLVPKKDHLNMGMVIANCAGNACLLGVDEAEKLCQIALSEFKAAGVDNNTPALQVYGTLSTFYRMRGKQQEALAAAEKALDIAKKGYGPDSPRTGTAKYFLAVILRDQKQYAAAENLVRDALKIEEQNKSSDMSATASCLHELGVIQALSGNTTEGLANAVKGVELAEKHWGSDSPYMCIPYLDLSIVQNAAGMLDDAKASHKKAQRLLFPAIGGTNALYGWLSAQVPTGAASSTVAAATPASTPATATPSTPAATAPTSASTSPGFIPNFQSMGGRPIGDKWALVIGISSFQDPSINLKYAAKDANDFATYLTTEAGFQKDHVTVLTNDQATRTNIMAYIGDKWLPRVAAPDDLVLIYISSHGSASSLDAEGLNYVVAHDTDKDSLFATGIPLQELTNMVKKRVHADRVVIMLDACHSGSAEVSPTKGLKRTGGFNAEAVAQGTGQLVICSSSPNEVSWESKKYQNGVFTHNLIEGLRKQGKNTTLTQAFEAMKDQVQQEVLRDRGEIQTPVIKSMWHGDDLRIASPPSKPRPGLDLQLSKPAVKPNK